MKKIVLLAFVSVLLSTAAVVWLIRPVVAKDAIYIRADGSVVGTDKIQHDGNIYTFTNNIYDEVVVERDNVVVDGAGYTLQGTGAFASTGIDLTGRNNTTVKNMRIRTFYYGIRLYESSNNTISWNNITNNEKDGIDLRYCSNNSISRNNMTNNEYGIRLYGSSSNTISGNNITNNQWDGIDLWYSSCNSILGNNIRNNGYGIYLHLSSDNTVFGNNVEINNWIGIHLLRSSNNNIYHNDFVDNPQQVNTRSSTNVWEDGAGRGNYWSDYEERYLNATEIDGTGIWNTPYVIDENNQDNYPIVPELPAYLTIDLVILIIAAIGILMGLIAYMALRKQK